MLLSTVIRIEVNNKGYHEYSLHSLLQVFLPVLRYPPCKIMRRSTRMFDLIGVRCLCFDDLIGLLSTRFLMTACIIVVWFLPPPAVAAEATKVLRIIVLVHV